MPKWEGLSDSIIAGGEFPRLRDLHIRGCLKLNKVSLPKLPLLETLWFENMPNWEEWSDSISAGGAFPRLDNLTVRDCPKLIKVSLPKLPSLEVEISECGEAAVGSIIGLASVTTKLMILKCGDLKYLLQDEAAEQNLANLRELSVYECPQLVSLTKEEQPLPQNLEHLCVQDCGNLEKLPSGLNNLTSLRKLYIQSCPRLVSFPDAGLPTMLQKLHIGDCHSLKLLLNNNSGMQNFSHLEELWISDCSSLTSFPTGRKLPTSLKSLAIRHCKKLEPNTEKMLDNNLSSLKKLSMCDWGNLKSFPTCLFSCGHLIELYVVECPDLESFPERCLPSSLRILSIIDCKNLKSLLDGRNMQTFASLEEMRIFGCPSLESFPQGRWPPNLRTLKIGDLNQRHPISEWGLRRLPPSLSFLTIHGDSPELVSLADKEGQGLLPNSVTNLTINKFVNLESLSSGLQNLTSLEKLVIKHCPQLRSLPDTLLPILSTLEISDCLLLKEKYRNDAGDYWLKIAHIPIVCIN